ncbi:uncharacterized protein LOC115243258 isoform X1 [Formica exsecta]|uniref:uncharacterized protein LOC115243258 isoform X1 n=2 Tax=Formica exsecta TaxID=72781 RepID=UPI001143098C|nr:uncharacterized protein LOC115243258 isoform X1 [Formica exsecta]
MQYLLFFYAIFIVFDTDQESKVLQKKWKNLRDTFRRKQQEMKAYVPSGSGAGKKSDDWKFYHLMEFFIPTLDFRKTHSNLGGFSRNENSCPSHETSLRFMPITTSTDTLLLSQSQPFKTAVIQKPKIVKSILLSPPTSYSSSPKPQTSASSSMFQILH